MLTKFVWAIMIAAVASLCQGRDFAAPGPFGHAYRTEDIPGTTETMRNSRIYYPDSAGTFPQAAVPAPIVAFGHGWMVGINYYYSYARHLASWGYVVVLPNYSNPIIVPEHDKRARLMADAARWTAARDTVAGDHFYGKLDRWNWGLAGHSMGGSISMLAMDTLGLGDTLRAAAALASPQSDPATHSAHLLGPKLVMAGGADNIAPWRGVRQAFWDSAPAPGTFAVIRGANHTDFMDAGFLLDIGCGSALGRETTQMVVRRHLTAFFERYLHGDRSEWNYAYVYGDSIVGHPTMDSVEVRPDPVGIESGTVETGTLLSVSPNPFRQLAHVNLVVPESGSLQVAVFNTEGRRVRTLAQGRRQVGILRLKWAGDDDSGRRLPVGAYFIKVSGVGLTDTRTLILLD
ncbi:MAG: FlgD immunoglobulin-like domain containing protein [candidate division WOR-3 bacterium]